MIMASRMVSVSSMATGRENAGPAQAHIVGVGWLPVEKPPPAWAENATAPTEKAAINGS